MYIVKEKKSNKTIFIVIGVIIIVVIAIFILFGRSDEKIYEVGKDIEAGEYVLVGTDTYTIGDVSDDDFGYYEICTTKDCNIDNNEVETNDNVLGKAYVVVEDGQYLKTKSMKLYSIDEYETSIANSISYDYDFGFNSYYKVGKDLSAGTYTLSGDSFYYQICSRPSCSILDGEILANENVSSANNPISLTLEDGQYLIVSGTEPFTVTKQ